MLWDGHQSDPFRRGHEASMKVRLSERGVYCLSCHMRTMDAGLNDLDWYALMKTCESCVGTNREPIPLAEVFNLRDLKMEIEQ